LYSDSRKIVDKKLTINDINLEITCLTDKEAEIINGGKTIVGPPGLAKKATSGFALERPGLIKNIRQGNGFAGPNAGNGANSGGAGNNGFQETPIEVN
jgi:hypothetical protein